PVYDNQYFDLGFPRGVRPCLVTLSKDTPSPFSAAAREPKPIVGGGKQGKDDSGGGTTIHLAGIQDRVLAFPVGEQRYTRIVGAKGRALFAHMPVEGSMDVSWRSSGAPPARQVLQAHIFDAAKTETVINGITDFDVSADGAALLVRIGNRVRALAATVLSKDLSPKNDAGRHSGWVDLERLRLEVEPALEWGQMFDEAWRLQRDQFWVADMTQIDWQDVHDRYRPLVDRVATRAEFSDLMWEMQGELGTSHCYELGGDYVPPPAWYQGQLGADIVWSSRKKRWVVQSIPRGDSWEQGATSPLTQPGIGVKVGDEILAVNGTACNAKTSPAMCLVNQAKRAVTLRVKSGSRTRTVTIETIVSDQMLRYRDWVETNRERVHKATRGRVGYVHVPNMGPWGFSEFHRYFKQEVDKPGLIVDVRYNGGGHVSQLLLQKLRRERVAYGSSRYMGVDTYPNDAPMGPMVCLTNEFAGSDGDIFSHSWKLYGLGPLIGKRTWGGVVGIWPRHALVDGTITTQPEFAHFFIDTGWGVENYGTDPDIEVDITPADWVKGRDPQMERGLAEIEKIIRKEKPKIPDMRKRPSLKVPKLPKRP
ncbi:MAG: PDZ domain-containing protein, partial [Planctomycetota bacterium]|nr:PDZ domain-containing protein [Planctomycetota bacterium]